MHTYINVFLRFWSLRFVHTFFHDELESNKIFIFLAIWSVVPEYMNEVLLFSIQENGLLSALPHLASFIVVMSSGSLADFIIQKQYLKRVNTRKLFHGIGTISPAICLLWMSFLNCERRYSAVLLLVIGVALK